jgi:hypothetical protein
LAHLEERFGDDLLAPVLADPGAACRTAGLLAGITATPPRRGIGAATLTRSLLRGLLRPILKRRVGQDSTQSRGASCRLALFHSSSLSGPST